MVFALLSLDKPSPGTQEPWPGSARELTCCHAKKPELQVLPLHRPFLGLESNFVFAITCPFSFLLLC